MGSVYLRGSRYWVKFRDESGRLVRKSAGTTRVEAVRLLRELEPARRAPEYQGPPFEDLADAYRDHLRVHAKSSTQRQSESCLGRLLECFAGRDAASLNPRDLDRFIRARQAQGVKPKTINGDLIVLRALLNHALRVGLLSSLPLRVRLLKAPRKRVVPILDQSELRRLLDKAREPYHGILLVCCHTGFRLDEVLHLTWGDCLWSEDKLAVTAKNGWSPKSHQERAVYVAPEVLSYLKRLRMMSRHRKDRDYVFATRSGGCKSVGNTLRTVRSIFKRANLYQKGVPLTHRIRHTVASRLLGEGVDVETVRSILGHADASTTLLYAQTTDARLRDAARVLALS